MGESKEPGAAPHALCVFYPRRNQGLTQFTAVGGEPFEGHADPAQGIPAYRCTAHADYLRGVTQRYVAERYACVHEGTTARLGRVDQTLRGVLGRFNSDKNPLLPVRGEGGDGGATHAGMSVGDVIQLDDRQYVVADRGFLPLLPANEPAQ